MHRDRAGGHLQRHQHRPGRAVGQHAPFGDRGYVGGAQETAQRREHAGGKQLKIT